MELLLPDSTTWLASLLIDGYLNIGTLIRSEVCFSCYRGLWVLIVSVLVFSYVHKCWPWLMLNTIVICKLRGTLIAFLFAQSVRLHVKPLIRRIVSHSTILLLTFIKNNSWLQLKHTMRLRIESLDYVSIISLDGESCAIAILVVQTIIVWLEISLSPSGQVFMLYNRGFMRELIACKDCLLSLYLRFLDHYHIAIEVKCHLLALLLKSIEFTHFVLI